MTNFVLFVFIFTVIINLIIAMVGSERKASIQSVRFTCVEIEIDKNNFFEFQTSVDITSTKAMQAIPKLHCSGYGVAK